MKVVTILIELHEQDRWRHSPNLPFIALRFVSRVHYYHYFRGRSCVWKVLHAFLHTDMHTLTRIHATKKWLPKCLSISYSEVTWWGCTTYLSLRSIREARQIVVVVSGASGTGRLRSVSTWAASFSRFPSRVWARDNVTSKPFLNHNRFSTSRKETK